MTVKNSCKISRKARPSFSSPNTIQQDIHPDIRPAGNSPAEYSAGTYFLFIPGELKKVYTFNEP